MKTTKRTLKKEYYGRVYKQGNHWKINVQHNGIRKTFYSYKKDEDAGRKDCAEQVINWLTQENTLRVTDSTTVHYLFQQFLEDKALEIRDVYNIENRYKNHIRPVIGAMPITEVSNQSLKRIVLLANAKNLSKKTLKNIRGDLSNFCTWLAESDIRYDLTTRRIKIPSSAPQGQRTILNATDIFTLFSNDTTIYENKICFDYWIYAFRFQLLYGLRPGELMGLEWGDFTEDSFLINRSINEKGKITPGKNGYAVRNLPLSNLAKEILSQQAKLRHNPNNPHERVFGEMGEICYRYRWHVYCELHKITRITPYEIRHTFASINKFIPQWILDVLMGHEHEGISLGVYAHALDGDMDGVSEMIDTNLRKQIERGRIKAEGLK